MRAKKRFLVAAVTVVCAILAPTAKAEEASSCTTITRANVVRCASAASLASKAETLGLESLDGRRRAASILLPSNPTLNLGGAYPAEASVPDRSLLWSASLSQEIEIAGQRGARLDVVSAEQRAQRSRLALARRDAGADALLLYFDALSAVEEAKIADRLAVLATALTVVAKARAQSGVSAGVEAQLASAAATRLLQGQIAAQQRLATTNASLASALGLNPTAVKPRVEGELRPVDVPDTATPAVVETAIARRAEVAVASAEAEAQENRIALYRKLRVPNPTISLYARNDWIGESSVGIGVGIPIPFPAPVGRTYAGEIAEASSLALRAQTETERLRRAVRLEVTKAFEVMASRRRQLDLYQPQQIRESEDSLRNIAGEIEAGRLPIREALITQQALIDYLYAHVEAQRQLCFASVELARAAGIPFERGGQ